MPRTVRACCPTDVLDGTVNGALGKSNFMITVVTSPGFMRTVSFQPRSSGAGGAAAPLKVETPLYRLALKLCREMICTLTRWKWIGCVSPVRFAICQTSVAPFVVFSVVGSR